MYCVYLFQHKQNHKIYVGRTKDFTKRLGSHVRTARSVRAHKTYFSSALAKYGLNAFNYFIIEQFDDFLECCEAEKFWIAYFQSNKRDIGYNLSIGGETNAGVSPSPATRLKISIAGKGRRKGIARTPEERMKISQTHKRNRKNSGSRNWHTSLTEKIVSEIKGLLQVGASPKYIRQKFGLHKMTVQHIKSGRSWSQVQPIVPAIITDNLTPKKNILKGSKNPASKLEEEQVVEIKKLLSEGRKVAEIARMFSVSWSLIKFIKLGTIWKHVV
jgi:group I intron endonuclease